MKTRTSSPRLVHLDAGAVELVLERGLAERAAERLLEAVGRLREHRLHRAEELEAEAARARAPSESAAAATAPRSPASMGARRTGAGGRRRPAADASAPSGRSSAPWRSSPTSRRGQEAPAPRAVALARAARRGAPRRSRPPSPPRRARRCGRRRRRSTSATVSVGSAAGAGRGSRSAAGPTPIRRWGSSPASQDRTGRTSSGRERQQRGEARDFAAPRRVAPTSAEAATSSARSMAKERETGSGLACCRGSNAATTCKSWPPFAAVSGGGGSCASRGRGSGGRGRRRDPRG